MTNVDIAEVRRILADAAEPAGKPDRWTGAYVGERLVRAFKVLATMPRVGHRTAFRQVTLEVLRDSFAEELELLQIDEVPATTRLRPTGRDIRLMENAVQWPVLYLPHDQMQRHSVMIWAHGIAHNRSAGRLAAKAKGRYGLSKQQFHSIRMAGCLSIALGLQRDRVPIE